LRSRASREKQSHLQEDYLYYLLKMKWYSCIVFFFVVSCSTSKSIPFPDRTKKSLTGSEFYRLADTLNWPQRDSLAYAAFETGNIPSFLKRFLPVQVSITDTGTQRKITAVFYTAPDYFSIGSNDDWCRVPLTPMTAQKIADKLNCFLPTRKMVDAVHEASEVKLIPEPLTTARDSSPTMLRHHRLIEAQRQGRKGLISGIKKDVVISGLLSRGTKMNRVAIYGWHKPDEKPIQPLYTGHVNWYVDYSHGIRLIYRKIKVDGKWMDYIELMKDPVLRRLICDEEYCDFYKYPY
jgi:hypothetical protein